MLSRIRAKRVRCRRCLRAGIYTAVDETMSATQPNSNILLPPGQFCFKNRAPAAISTAALRQEKQKSDDLLLNILPAEVAEELKISGTSVARLFDEVTVLFTDFVNFTIASEVLTPQQLVTELDTCFREFDRIIGKHGIEKIKTVGDAYLAVAGLPTADPNHAENVVRAAMEINEFIHDRISKNGENAFRIRIGIHSGNVVAGIVGVKKFAYDIWGDTVNTAARLEQKGAIKEYRTKRIYLRQNQNRNELKSKNVIPGCHLQRQPPVLQKGLRL